MNVFGKDPINYVRNHQTFNMTIDQGIAFLTEEIKATVDFNLYEVIVDDKLIGTFGIEQSFNVHPFSIIPEYRNKQIANDFWNCVLDKVDKRFISSIYETNIPGKKFLLSRGGRLIGTVPMNGTNLLVFEFNKR